MSILDKSKKILRIILFTLCIILLRLWQLTVIEQDIRVKKAYGPTKKEILQTPERGVIQDRFGIPLALNQIQYNVCIQYSELKKIPATKWVDNNLGEKIKIYPRKNYILELSELLSKELEIPTSDIEDQIYSKAALFHQVPYVLKQDLTEKQFYRLKNLERNWSGIFVDYTPKRSYPREKVAGSSIGHLGLISQREYQNVAKEIQSLRALIEEGDEYEYEFLQSANKRLLELETKAYNWKDAIGKTGVEALHEEDLRGYYGSTYYETDAKGNLLQKLPGGKESIAGKTVSLSLSSELQEYAEYLLSLNEKTREGRSEIFDRTTGRRVPQKQPWIKGGAIVAMDPKTGEILALASYPRENPNDYISSANTEIQREKFSNIKKWLEVEGHISQIWDQLVPLEKEIGGFKELTFYNESQTLTWETYLKQLFQETNPIFQQLNNLTVEEAYYLISHTLSLLSLSELSEVKELINLLYTENPFKQVTNQITMEQASSNLKASSRSSNALKSFLDQYLYQLTSNRDKLLFLDLCRLCLGDDNLNADLIPYIGKWPLSQYRQVSACFSSLSIRTKEAARNIYHTHDFQLWREENQVAFLREKRRDEKESNSYQKPYLDYLNSQEEVLFNQFWDANRFSLVSATLLGKEMNSKTIAKEYCTTVNSSSFKVGDILNRINFLKENVLSLPSDLLPTLFKSFKSYQEHTNSLWAFYPRVPRRNGKQTQKELIASFYPLYGYGYTRSEAYRTSATQGSLFKIITAYQALLDTYKGKIKKGQRISSTDPIPLLKINERKIPGSKSKGPIMCYRENGNPVYQHYKGGKLLKSTHPNAGRLELQSALEISSNVYFSILASDVIESPENLNTAAKAFGLGEKTGFELKGEYSGNLPNDLDSNTTGLFAYAIGQHTLTVTPIQSAIMLSAFTNGGNILKPHIIKNITGNHPFLLSSHTISKKPQTFPELYKKTNISFPLFTQVEPFSPLFESHTSKHKPRWKVWMPYNIKQPILEGMARFTSKKQNEDLWSLSRYFQNNKKAINDYLSLKNQLIGKSSTAESVEIIDLDSKKGKDTYHHIWFGGISYNTEDSSFGLPKDPYSSPELVVIVYLKYGGWGKEAAPLAAQIVKKWREINKKHITM